MVRIASALVAMILLPGVLLGCGDGDGSSRAAGGTGGVGGSGGTGGAGGTGGTGGGGTAGSGGSGGTGGSETRTIQVDGRVLDPMGAPVVGAVVVLNGASDAPALTGPDGAFVFREVETPYDLMLVSPPVVTEIRAIDIANPVLRTFPGSTDEQTALLGIRVTGASFPLPAGESIRIAARDGYTDVRTASTLADGTFTDDFRWSGPATFTTDLVALHTFTDASGAVHYLRSGALGVRLVAGELLEGLVIDLDREIEVTSTTFTHDPGPHTIDYVTKLGFLVRGARFVETLTQPSGSTVEYPVEAAIFRANGYTSAGGYSDQSVAPLPDGETVIRLPETSQLANSLPVDGAVGLSTTPTLMWSPVAGSTINVVAVNTAAGGYIYALPGDTNRLEIPDYAGLGIGLAPDTTYSWAVQSYIGAAYTTNAVAEQFVVPDRSFRGPGIRYQSDPTSFTTAP